MPSPLLLAEARPRLSRWTRSLRQRLESGSPRGSRSALAGCATRVGSSALRLLALLPLLLLLGMPHPVLASPGLCVGPVCGDAFTRSAKHVFQLRLRLSDQRGHHERVTVDCRDGRISPAIGPVERGYGAAVARRACRLAGQAPA